MTKPNATAQRLPPRQARFVQEYLLDLNATQAAIRAGYSAKTADVQGPRLLGNVRVQAELTAARLDRSRRTAVTADRVIRELAALGFADMRHYIHFGEDGQAVFDWSAMPEEATRAIAEVTQEEYLDGLGTGARLVRKTRFRLHDKKGALELLARHLGMLVDRHEHTGRDGGPIELTLADAIKLASGDESRPSHDGGREPS